MDKRFNVISANNVEPKAIEIKGDRVFIRSNVKAVKYQSVDNPTEPEVIYYCYDETEQVVFDYILNISKIEPLAARTLTASEIFEEMCSNDNDDDESNNISLEDFKTLRINKLKEECSSTIYNGFTSDSTGYTFGFNALDQANITQQALLILVNGESSVPPIQWKTKDSGVVTLTKQEFLSIIEEAKTHKLTNQSKYWTLEAQILSATDKEAVCAVEW